MLISFPDEPDNIGLKPNDVMWGDGDLTPGADGKGVDDMNWAGVVNCAHVDEDCAGVDVNCVGVDLDDVCAGVDDDCTGVDNVWVGVGEVCAVEDVHYGIGMTGLLASGSLSSSSTVSSWSSWLPASWPYLNASIIARSCSNLGRDLLLLMSAKAISTGHRVTFVGSSSHRGLLLHVSNNKNKHKTIKQYNFPRILINDVVFNKWKETLWFNFLAWFMVHTSVKLGIFRTGMATRTSKSKKLNRKISWSKKHVSWCIGWIWGLLVAHNKWQYVLRETREDLFQLFSWLQGVQIVVAMTLFPIFLDQFHVISFFPLAAQCGQ